MLILATAIRSSVLLFSSKLQVTNIIGDQERERERGRKSESEKKMEGEKNEREGQEKNLILTNNSRLVFILMFCYHQININV